MLICIDIHVYVYIYIHNCMYIYICTYYICANVCMHLCMYACMDLSHVRMYACTDVRMHAWMDGWMDGWMDACRQAGMHVSVFCIIYAYASHQATSHPYQAISSHITSLMTFSTSCLSDIQLPALSTLQKRVATLLHAVNISGQLCVCSCANALHFEKCY